MFEQRFITVPSLLGGAAMEAVTEIPLRAVEFRILLYRTFDYMQYVLSMQHLLGVETDR